MIITKWKRTCQECGAEGYYKKPNLESKSEGWQFTKCRKCKSEALDFGTEVDIDDTTGNEIEYDWTSE